MLKPRSVIIHLFFNVTLSLGLLKSIGVSNYTVAHLEEMLQYATVVPSVLQVRSQILIPFRF